jgi:hypothetical protein
LIAGPSLAGNDAFERPSGYTASQLLGRRPRHLLQGPDTDSATAACEALQQSRALARSVAAFSIAQQGLCGARRDLPDVADARGAGMGLDSMRYRASAHGARLEIGAASGGGVCVAVLFPWPPRDSLAAGRSVD